MLSEFILQSVFTVGGKVVLMGRVTKGEIKTGMKATIGKDNGQILDIESFGKHPTSIKFGDKEAAAVGISISNVSTKEAQSHLNSKIEFQ